MHNQNIIVWYPGMTLESLEEQIIKRALSYYRGNKTMTANSLGIAVRTLDNKLEKYFEDGKKQERSMQEEKKKRDEFLLRCRGKLPSPEKTQDFEQKIDIDESIQTTNLRSKKRG